MFRIAMLPLLASISMTTAGTAAEEEFGIVVLREGETLEEVLGIDRASNVWVAVDGGMIRPLSGLAGLDPGLHDLFLHERSEAGEIVDPRWVTVDVVDPLASGRDAFPLTYLIDRRPPRLEARESAFIRPGDPLPIAAYDESGIGSLAYRDGDRRVDVGAGATIWPVGRHTVEVEGVDRAGNRATLRLEFEVDDQPPAIALAVGDRITDDGVALSVAGRGEVTASATDDRSGVASLLFRMGDDRWRGVRGPIEVDDEVGFIEFLATDNAGNQQVVRREVRP